MLYLDDCIIFVASRYCGEHARGMPRGDEGNPEIL